MELDSELMKAMTANAHAAAAVAVLMINVATLIAKQPGFDRRAFLDDLRKLRVQHDMDKTYGIVYEQAKDQLISNIEDLG